jgi:hypothetical protein
LELSDIQLKNFLTVNWLLLEFDPSEYKDKYKEIERLLGAIKNIRSFEQL